MLFKRWEEQIIKDENLLLFRNLVFFVSKIFIKNYEKDKKKNASNYIEDLEPIEFYNLPI